MRRSPGRARGKITLRAVADRTVTGMGQDGSRGRRTRDSRGHLDRIFEPFFTTKETGTGYGLYLASEILNEHGGRLSASNPGGGACFTVWLPTVPTAAPEGKTGGAGSG